MSKMTILCDMDGIIVNLSPYWLEEIYQDHGVKVTQEEITQWAMHKCGGLKELGADKVYAYLQREKFFRNAPSVPGAIAGLKRLNDHFNVVICSSPSGPYSAKEKYEWLAEHCPFIKADQIILATQKTLIKGDVLIDDHPETGIAYRAAWPQSLVLGIEYEYNKNVPQERYWLTMCKDYKSPIQAWGEIVDRIMTHADLHDRNLLSAT